MQALSSRFRINQATYFEGDDSHGAELEVELQHPSSPDNLILYVWLRLDGNGLVDIADTLARLDTEMNLIETMPSVVQHVRPAPRTRFVIHDRDDASATYRNIATQLQIRAIQRLPELKHDDGWRQNAILLDEGDQFWWMILPDHRAIRWENASDATGATHCAVETDSGGSRANEALTNLCEGIVYGANGNVVN